MIRKGIAGIFKRFEFWVRSEGAAAIIRFLIKGRFHHNQALVLTSSPRSGSTLLAQALTAIPKSCVLFEPLFIESVGKAKAAGFGLRTYVEPDKEWPEGEQFLQQAFEGRIVNGWTAREMDMRKATKYKRLIVKFVRANRLLPWICQRFELPTPVLLLRHPCAVVASQLNIGWRKPRRPDIPPYLNEFPRFQAIVKAVEGDEEYLAVLWALDQLPALLQACPRPWTIVTYEELLFKPEETLTRILDAWNFKIDLNLALKKIQAPSSVVSGAGISGIDGWKQSLTKEQISKILAVVNAFGLSFYSNSVEPDYENLFSEKLPQQIRNAGSCSVIIEPNESLA